MKNHTLSIFLYLSLFSLPGRAIAIPADSLKSTRPASATTTGAEFNIRINYLSRAVFSGRDFGVREWMSTPSITYYAKSGFYADISGYYLSQSQPHYELTALSAGYLGIINSYFVVSGELSRTILSQRGQQNLLPYSADASFTYNLSPLLSATTDYNLLFGNATAHRLRLSVSAYMVKALPSTVLGLKRISVSPALIATLGTETSAYNLYQPGTVTGTTTMTPATTRLTRIRQRLQALKSGTATTAEAGYNGFGLMAMDFSVPIRVTFAGFRIGLNNHFVRPFKLYADEELSTDVLYYADVSLTWIIK